jgi:phage gp16-like protein
MSDGDYRAMLRSVGKVESAKDLDWAGRQAMLDALRKLGWKNRRARPRGPQATTQSDKIKALWLELARVGGTKDASEAALSAFCRRMVRVDRAEWMTVGQAQKVIECLKQWLKRVQDEQPVP